MQGTRLLMAGGIRVRCSPAGRLQATARVGASWRACGERCLLWEGHRPALLEATTRSARRPRRRTRTGYSFRGCGTHLRFARLGQSSPLQEHPARILGTWAHHYGEAEPGRAEPASREIPTVAACLWMEENAFSLSPTADQPPRRQPQMCGAFLAQARTVRAKRVPQPAEGMPRASPADYEHNGQRLRLRNRGLSPISLRERIGLLQARPVALAVDEKTGAEAPVFTFKPVEVTD
ncbi:hypothetical protein CKCBHOJB_00692 [Thauera sp. GDN1]|nr:hypothetical protein CKCBHOJB_00692 [Thauera sp. GDN1]